MPLLERLALTEATRQWPVWGTTARIVVTDSGPDGATADAAERLVAGRLAEIDAACSRFRQDSELALVQRRLTADPDLPVTISPLLADLITAGLAAARQTGGAVDPTLADDLAALGYDRDYAQLNLTCTGRGIPVQLTRRIRHRWQDVTLRGNTLSMPARTRLDLGASAKAFAADRAAAAVAAEFGCGVLVALGGDIATAGPAPANGWQVLVQDGVDEPADLIRLESAGLATSSTISRRWRNGTRAVHHILDPANGRPADPIWRTVSVAAGSCEQANALSTATIVLGWEGLDALRESRCPARLVSVRDEIITLGGWPVTPVSDEGANQRAWNGAHPEGRGVTP